MELQGVLYTKTNQKISLSQEHTNYKWCDFKEAYQTLEKENNKNTLKLINKELIN